VAMADVGVTTVIENSGTTLLSGDLMDTVEVRRQALSTTRNIRRNPLFVFVFNAASVPIATGVLYPLAVFRTLRSLSRQQCRCPETAPLPTHFVYGC
jgi:cation transport ATPase